MKRIVTEERKKRNLLEIRGHSTYSSSERNEYENWQNIQHFTGCH